MAETSKALRPRHQTVCRRQKHVLILLALPKYSVHLKLQLRLDCIGKDGALAPTMLGNLGTFKGLARTLYRNVP